MRANSRTNFLTALARAAAAVIFSLCIGVGIPAHAEIPQQVGTSTGLPIPRYVSLKTNRVNLRQGPSIAHRTEWIYERAGLPVEVTAESDDWRKIRDSEGTVGWVSESLLSGRRTVLVAPWKKHEMLTLYTEPASTSSVAANLQAGVLGTVKSCDGNWCRIDGKGFDGYIPQTSLWGVYPGEKVTQ